MSGPDDNDDRELDEDPMLTSMRAVWVSMRDEEPSGKGLDALMSAAREQAARMQPETKPSWWQQLVASLRRPPVLALATVVVLVGGAVVIGGHRDQFAVKAPVVEHVGGDGDATATASHDGAGNKAGELSAKLDEKQATATVPSGGDKKTEATTSTATTATTPPVAQTRAQPSPPRVPSATDHAMAGESRAGAGSAAASPDPEPSKNDGGTGGLVPPNDVLAKESTQNLPRTNAQLEIAVDGREASKDAKAPKKEMESRDDESPTRVKSSAPDAPRRPEPTAPPPRRTADSDQLVKQTENAAANGDCTAVRVMAEQIRKMDSEAYKTRVKTSSTIAKCLK